MAAPPKIYSCQLACCTFVLHGCYSLQERVLKLLGWQTVARSHHSASCLRSDEWFCHRCVDSIRLGKRLWKAHQEKKSALVALVRGILTSVLPVEHKVREQGDYAGSGEIPDDIRVTPACVLNSTPLWHLQELYSVIQKRTGIVGGNGTGGAIYGEMTMVWMPVVAVTQ
jgi:hypothetical protein